VRKFLSLVLLVIAILCASCSHGSVWGNSESASIEIRFHEIEWGSSSESVSLMITDAGGSPSVSRNAYLAYPDSVFDYSPLAPNAGNLVADSSLDVIGYNAVSMFFFSYRITNSVLISRMTPYILYAAKSLQTIANTHTKVSVMPWILFMERGRRAIGREALFSLIPIRHQHTIEIYQKKYGTALKARSPRSSSTHHPRQMIHLLCSPPLGGSMPLTS